MVRPRAHGTVPSKQSAQSTVCEIEGEEYRNGNLPVGAEGEGRLVRGEGDAWSQGARRRHCSRRKFVSIFDPSRS